MAAALVNTTPRFLDFGIERLAKLILIADFALNNVGALPSQMVVRRYGHRIRDLISKIDEIASSRDISVPYLLPSDPICSAVIDCLDAFSDASKGRYANFEAIGNPNFNFTDEPVNMWWIKVVEPILEKHYRGKQAERRVKQNAAIIDSMIGGMTMVRHTSETGGILSDVTDASERTGQTKRAQKYGRYYTLSVVRWLSHIFDEMTHTSAHQPGLASLFGHYEFFQTYTVEDNFLKTRKVWPLV
jgi:hypothetical protein